MQDRDDHLSSLWRDLEERIGHHFADRSLLAEALTHRSFANEAREAAVADNERLEFLGDAVLDLCVSRCLLRIHPEAPEGELTRLRSELVNEPTLAALARELRLGDCLLLGRGEARSGGHAKESLLADSFEALLGAVFIDGGYDRAAGLVERLLGTLLSTPAPTAGHDYKTRLQELAQGRQLGRPEYRLVGASGPDHCRHYDMQVLVDGRMLGRGTGATKKRAEQEAARLALARLELSSHD